MLADEAEAMDRSSELRSRARLSTDFDFFVGTWEVNWRLDLERTADVP